METKERPSVMQPRTSIRLAVLLAAIFAAAPAGAQLYKWVDERGVTNYSNQPPADPRNAKNLRPVEDRISVYTPDQALTQAVDDLRQGYDRATAERIASLERELEAERRARQYAAAQAQPVLDYSGYDPYEPAFVAFPPRHRSRRLNQIQLPPGAIAGNVVGTNGFIPGNSAAASPRPAFPSRSPREAPRSARLPEK
jgi:hypothetical protein